MIHDFERLLQQQQQQQPVKGCFCVLSVLHSEYEYATHFVRARVHGGISSCFRNVPRGAGLLCWCTTCARYAHTRDYVVTLFE